jgi:hypothetical protein
VICGLKNSKSANAYIFLIRNKANKTISKSEVDEQLFLKVHKSANSWDYSALGNSKVFSYASPQLQISKLKGTWQRGGFSGVFAEIGSA